MKNITFKITLMFVFLLAFARMEGQNLPPIAVDDEICGLPQNTPVNINVMDNDSDPNGDNLIINTTPITTPSDGTVVINPNGSVTYVPDAGFCGIDSFTYQICDDQTPTLCDVAIVTIYVCETCNIAPACNEDPAYTAEDTPVTIPVLDNDSDYEGCLEPPTLSIISQPSFGNATVNSNYDIDFTPNPGANAIDSLVYQVCDCGTPVLCCQSTVTIQIGEPTATGGCAQMLPFCTDSGTTFPASTNTQAEAGNTYGCLGAQPNPAWYYLEIDEPGLIEITLTNSKNVDVDFILYGPFADTTTAINSCGSLTATVAGGACGVPITCPNPASCTSQGNTCVLGDGVDCSFSGQAVEVATIPNGSTGEVYILLITNYSGEETEISANQTGGTGSTNCSIVTPPCELENIVITGNCTNSPIQFYSNFTSLSPGYVVNWDFGDSTVSTLNTPYHTYTTAGTYTVTLTVYGANGCEESIQSDFIVDFCDDCPLIAGFNIPEDICISEAANFSAVVQDAMPNSLLWDFGDGNTSTEIAPAHQYTAAGAYTIILSLMGPDTCTVISNTDISVKCCNPDALLLNSSCLYDTIYFDLPIGSTSNGADVTWDFGDGTSGVGASTFHVYPALGSYLVSFSYNNQTLGCDYNLLQRLEVFNCTLEKEDCVTAFAPKPGESYVLSAWVKEANAIGALRYDKAVVYLEFTGINTLIGPFKASKEIIDGWQLIEERFEVPIGATDIIVQLVNEDLSNKVYFDDIRIHPFKATMKSFVYDPSSLRLWAEMDERNYATYYEYDEEGALIRIEKETHKGRKTIQESANNTHKAD